MNHDAGKEPTGITGAAIINKKNILLRGIQLTHVQCY
jgi:hypothetical protein